MHSSKTNPSARWAALCLFGACSLTLPGCESRPNLYETKYSGSYTDRTETRSNKNAACNFETRVRNWAAFGTGYGTKSVSNQPDVNNPGYSQIRTRRSSIAEYFLGYDPDPSMNFRNIDVEGRWGAGPGVDRPYLSTAANVPDGTNGFHLRIADYDSRVLELRFMIAHRELRPILDSPRLMEYRSDDKLVVTIQFSGGKPFKPPAGVLDVSPSFAKNGVLSLEIEDGYGGWAGIDQDYRPELLSYLLIAPHPSSRLEITLSDPTQKQPVYTAHLDMRDAREAFNRTYPEFLNLADKGCTDQPR